MRRFNSTTDGLAGCRDCRLRQSKYLAMTEMARLMLVITQVCATGHIVTGQVGCKN